MTLEGRKGQRYKGNINISNVDYFTKIQQNVTISQSLGCGCVEIYVMDGLFFYVPQRCPFLKV